MSQSAPESAVDSDPADTRKVRRWQVMRRLLKLYDAPRYLEIGVCQGKTFDRVPADRKVAVDPAFRFDHVAMQEAHPEATYYPVPSDDYFTRHATSDDEFDLIYLDGLHVYDQTLRDLLNGLEHLQRRGVIVIDDTMPPTSLAAIRERRDFDAERRRTGSDRKEWMGDVFKVVHFIQAFCPYLRYATIENNHGQTVVWRGRRGEQPLRELSEIHAMTFDDFTQDLSVMRIKPFDKIRRELRRDLGL